MKTITKVLASITIGACTALMTAIGFYEATQWNSNPISKILSVGNITCGIGTMTAGAKLIYDSYSQSRLQPNFEPKEPKSTYKSSTQ